jgi:HD-GYP domain-containing protein (c-di-GMP phosphodiesterase class II)
LTLRLRALLVIGLVAVCAAVGMHFVGALDRLELDTVDLRFSLRDKPPPDDIVVVAVDDVTFSDLDLQWPFPRSRFGRAVDKLHAAGAREIVLDIQFTEQTKPREDFALYDAIDRAGGAVLATSETDGHGKTNVLGGDENLARIDARAAAANLPEDGDGVIRRFQHSEGGLETLAVAVAERAGKQLRASDFESGGSWIDYRGGPETVRTISFSDLLLGRADSRAFRGKIVVLGASAPTLHDVHPTSSTGDALMAGPEVQANAIWSALNGLPLRSAPGIVDLLAILLLAMAVPVAATRMGVTVAALGGLVLGVGYAVAAQVAFGAGIVVTLVAPLVALLLSTILTVAASYLIEAGERRRVARLNELLEQKVRERTGELRETQLEIIERLGKAVEWRDEETGGHIDRMSRLCHRLGLAAGMEPDRAELLRRASVMHDVGKIGVPDSILRKPGPLDHDEWEVMKTHTTIGGRILSGSRSPLVQMAETIALTHHERWDGSGYPAGLSGESIPLVGRICAVCDVFDALISDRPYKSAWPVADALEEIRTMSGQHLDPALAELFLVLAPELLRELGLDRADATGPRLTGAATGA